MKHLPTPRTVAVTFEEGDTNSLRIILRDTDTQQTMAIQSPLNVEPLTDRQFRMSLDVLMVNLGHILRQHLFPRDTLIYDQIDGPTGKRLANPRYPV